jgi:hypothetical protein
MDCELFERITGMDFGVLVKGFIFRQSSPERQRFMFSYISFQNKQLSNNCQKLSTWEFQLKLPHMVDSAQHPRRTKSLATPPWEPKILQVSTGYNDWLTRSGAESFLRSRQVLSSQEPSPHCVEPGSSLQNLQMPSIPTLFQINPVHIPHPTSWTST